EDAAGPFEGLKFSVRSNTEQDARAATETLTRSDTNEPPLALGDTKVLAAPPVTEMRDDIPISSETSAVEKSSTNPEPDADHEAARVVAKIAEIQSILLGEWDGRRPRRPQQFEPGRPMAALAAPPSPANGSIAANDSGQSQVRIEIDLSEFQLAILQEGRPLRIFTVALGAPNTTPTGEFRIVNKLTDPDWYNRGEVVKSGNPRNPLGKRWMGFENELGPTAYGIHEATDLTLIGKEVGRGCIRMRLNELDTVFRMCPVGTPVTIRP
ncbi:MAG: L,D-transpeptidase, partial [Candidatus Hydrogenedentes bacterium]|nr:L,D-transpeptidase [Candidatus Hydrogenedentota bacterium]